MQTEAGSSVVFNAGCHTATAISMVTLLQVCTGDCWSASCLPVKPTDTTRLIVRAQGGKLPLPKTQRLGPGNARGAPRASCISHQFGLRSADATSLTRYRSTPLMRTHNSLTTSDEFSYELHRNHRRPRTPNLFAPRQARKTQPRSYSNPHMLATLRFARLHHDTPRA